MGFHLNMLLEFVFAKVLPRIEIKIVRFHNCGFYLEVSRVVDPDPDWIRIQ
jgi:hypothetical protein